MAGRTARLAIGGAVIAAALFTGCAQSPGNYATVNGVDLPASEVRDTTDAINEEIGQETFATNDIGNVAILHIIAEGVADEQDIELSPSDLTKYVSDQGGQQLLESGDAAEQYALDVAFVSLVEGEIGTEAFAAELADSDVHMNPRFGTWSPGSLVSVESGSLGEVAPAAPSN